MAWENNVYYEPMYVKFRRTHRGCQAKKKEKIIVTYCDNAYVLSPLLEFSSSFRSIIRVTYCVFVCVLELIRHFAPPSKPRSYKAGTWMPLFYTYTVYAITSFKFTQTIHKSSSSSRFRIESVSEEESNCLV